MTTFALLGLTSDEVQQLLSGLWVAIKVTALSLLIAFPLGALLGAGAAGSSRIARWVSVLIIELGRGIPALVLLYLLYFGLPSIEVLMGSMTAATLGLGLSTAAYTGETFRTAIRAVPRGQREAAAGLGLSPSTSFMLVILPQALRIASPQLVSLTILTFQATALCFAIALPEILSHAYQIGNVNFRYLDVLLVAAGIYAVLLLPGAKLARYLEKRSSARL